MEPEEMYPQHLYYNRQHGWIAVEGAVAVQGLTAYGQHIAGKIAFVRLPRPGRLVSQGQPLLSLESGKWVGRLAAGVSGKVAEANQALESRPTLINTSPYEAGWLVKIELSDPADLANLMRAGSPEFEQYLADEHLKHSGK